MDAFLNSLTCELNEPRRRSRSVVVVVAAAADVDVGRGVMRADEHAARKPCHSVAVVPAGQPVTGHGDHRQGR